MCVLYSLLVSIPTQLRSLSPSGTIPPATWLFGIVYRSYSTTTKHPVYKRIYFKLYITSVRVTLPTGDVICRLFSHTRADTTYLPVNFLSAQREGTYTASVNKNDSWLPISPLDSPILAASTPT